MTSLQNAREYAMDQMKQGKITAAQANVLVIQIAGILVIKNKIPMDVRKALNAAVKAGELGRLKKDGLKPEIYHHANARPRAIEEQNRIVKKKADSLKGMFA